MHTPSPFEQLLQAASEQADPQRLLFVFAGAELPPDATPAQQRHFAAGAGGTLVPLMCVDKGLDELTGFDALVAESHSAGPRWQVVFAAALSGRGGRPPTLQQIDQALQRLTERVRDGAIDGLLALAPSGESLQFFGSAQAASA